MCNTSGESNKTKTQNEIIEKWKKNIEEAEKIMKSNSEIIENYKDKNKETSRMLMAIEASRLEIKLKSAWNYDEIINRMTKDRYKFLHVEYNNILTKRLVILSFEDDYYTVIVNYDIYDGLKSIKVKLNNNVCIEI